MYLFANNATSALAAAITSTGTALSLNAGTGALFPADSAGSWWMLTLLNVATGAVEVVKVISRTNDSLTVERAQEGTVSPANGWPAGTTVYTSPTRDAMANMAQKDAANTFTQTQTAPQFNIGDANARIKRIGTMLALENDVNLSFVVSKTGVYLECNAKHDGTNHNRMDTTQPAALLRVYHDGTIHLYRAAAGANPIAWDPALTLWHSGNDGAGSGLDADLLDGLQPATAATGNTIAQRDAAGALTVASATAAGHAVTKAQLNAPGSAPTYTCRAWANFNGTGTPTIRMGGNCSSITDNGTGDYTVNFTVAMPDANYAAVVNATNSSGTYLNQDSSVTASSYTTGSVRVQILNSSALADALIVSVAIFR